VTTSATAWRQPDPGWRRVGRSLVRELSFRDFDEAFGFVQRVANEAVDYMRRPDICIFGFNRVRLTVANPHHAGLTEAELRLARRVDAILDPDGEAQP
jgi:4a-hydroxytetrahydrobiopterin dehydratase